MPPEDVVNALRRMTATVRPGGSIIDLQVIRPDPWIELDGRPLARIDGAPLFAWADAAVAAIDARIAAGELHEEAVDDHDVRTHYPTGADVLEDFEDSKRTIDPAAVPTLRSTARPLVVRERCRTRLLRVG